MNGANQNEIDLMLRTLARAEKNPTASRMLSRGDGAAPSDHLDADELNSYAEGLVPAPARARYTKHLAECAVCRGIVVDLTQAAGASARHEAPESRSDSSFWQKLAALFAPSVLRYAVPVLLLTVVIGIGLFALRRQNENALVAVNRPVAVQPAPSENNNPAPSNVPAPQSPGEVAAPSEPAKTEDKPKKPEVSQTPVDSVSTLEKEAPAKAAKDADEAGAGTSVPGELGDLRASGTVQPKTAPPPPVPFTADKSSDYAFSRDKREEQERALEELKRQDEDVHGPNRARNAAPMSTAQRAVGGLARNERGPSAMNKNKGAETESRAVAGKRFTRDEGVWIDVDYQSQATTRVTRGSEQFRALVADEPGIGTIAERLDGPIIVVWKGRAYRIQ
jgi:hypothetical protein